MFDSVIEINVWKIKHNIELSSEAEDELEELFRSCKHDDGGC